MDLNKAEFETKLLDLLDGLYSLVDTCCTNVLSNKHTYILTEIDIHSKSNADPFLRRVATVKAKKNQKKLNFKEVSARLYTHYPDIYDLIVTVFQSKKHETIIEFSYLLKSALEPAHRELVQNVEPMYHAKLASPFYLKDHKVKFDVNWEHQEWKNWWKRIVWKWRKYKSNGHAINVKNS